MDGDEIGIVLSRASELRAKINNCIDKVTRHDKDYQGENGFHSLDDGGEADDEAESLLNIRDALESLEEQLSSLQALQQQQRYEREATLAEIDHSRKILLNKLEEYKGEDLVVIHEASAFASETVEQNDDLLLPPYPSRPPRSLVLGNGYSSNFSSASKFSSSIINDFPVTEAKKSTSELDKTQSQAPGKSSSGGLRLLSLGAKAALTLVSVISVLSLAGFKPRLTKTSTQFKALDMFQKPTAEEKRTMIECPPGKVLVMEDGEPRCLVKERVEIPFEPVVNTPDVSYGYG
ncbi:PREDICTED: plastid division protein PDV2-like isoform X1 [Nelumbo nucifera]|uniref:Plastid division protein PDV2-like isoform X1 n=1 Tax=Nelumbo nucifera TaxID=4432 RepID=A0A1U7Z8E2_NELNU|nr:PREDICTED: plastid division protein PDV2-like isoform X1 [Nelumbo nucifera]